MLKKFFSMFVAVCIVITNISTANAVVFETIDLGIDAVDGLLQTDDEELVNDIMKKLSDDSEKEKLKKYVEKTRSEIIDKSKFFHDVITPAYVWVTKKSPTVGKTLADGFVFAYIKHYESKLEDDSSDILKKFSELREHNIEAGKELFSVIIDAYITPRDKNESGLSVVSDAALVGTKGAVQINRYKSSAVSLAKVMEAAGIEVQPEDFGDICLNEYKSLIDDKKGKDSKTSNKSNKPNNNTTTSNTTESLSNVRLGDSIDSTESKLGQATKKTVKEEGKLRYEYPTMDVAYDYGKVVGLAADATNIKTSKGIHAGSSLQEVFNKYGKNYTLSTYDNLDLYEYFYKDNSGKDYIVRFAVKQNSGTVKYISIRYAD